MSPIERPKKQRGLFPDVTPQEPELARQSIAATTPAGPFQLRQALRWREDVPNSVAWSPDGQFLASGAADTATPPGEKRDVILWDLGGQDEYRLVHQLLLHDTTLALVLLDPTRGRTAFEEVEEWNLRLEKQLHGRKTVKLLVGTNLDEASTLIDRTSLDELRAECGFADYYETSAKTSCGIAELRATIAKALDWENLSKTTRPVLFQRIRDEIETRQKKGEVVLLYDDLEKQLRQDDPEQYESDDVQTVVQQLTLQGVIADTRISSGQRALVRQIGQIERYAGSLIIAARNNVLRIAVWHHPATGNEKIQDDAFLERLRPASVRLCLHGHVHEDRADLISYLHPTRKIHIAGAGSFGAVAKDRPESIPRLYNVIKVERDHSKIRVHTWCMRKDGGAWEGWAIWPGSNAHEKRTYYEIDLSGVDHFRG